MKNHHLNRGYLRIAFTIYENLSQFTQNVNIVLQYSNLLVSWAIFQRDYLCHNGPRRAVLRPERGHQGRFKSIYKGMHSVGVAPQYASTLGKNANCQTLVSLTLASREVPVMVGLRLFLPESWTSDPTRLDHAGVPLDYRDYRTKPEIALAEIDRVRSAGARFGCVLADAGYGMSASFRQGLSARGLTWAVGIPYKQKVYPADVAMIFPVAGRGRPRKRHIPDATSVSAKAMLEVAKWRKVSWRRGTKGLLSARFAAVRVRVADGPPQRIWNSGAQHLRGEEVWLVGEHRSTGERK